MNPVRVVVVDDSATMRALIVATLRRDPGIRVVTEAADPFEARAAIKAHDPQVITLDVEMPGMNGLDFLERIMRLRPTPVVMASTITHAGAEAAVQAPVIGAVDCVGKPDGTGRGFEDLAARVRAAAVARVGVSGADAAAPTPSPFVGDRRLIAIGTSTGGVKALHVVLGGLPTDGPPMVVTQHMPANFLRAFAQRLGRHCALTVMTAEDGMPIRPGHAYVAPGEHHLEVAGAREWRCRLVARQRASAERGRHASRHGGCRGCAGDRGGPHGHGARRSGGPPRHEAGGCAHPVPRRGDERDSRHATGGVGTGRVGTHASAGQHRARHPGAVPHARVGARLMADVPVLLSLERVLRLISAEIDSLTGFATAAGGALALALDAAHPVPPRFLHDAQGLDELEQRIAGL